MEFSINQLKNEILAELNNATDLDIGINTTLKMIGQFFNVDRVYVFENIENTNACRNTYEWCNTGISPEIQNLQYLDYAENLDNSYKDQFNEEGIFFCPSINNLPPRTKAVLASQGIVSMLQYVIKEQGEFKGFIGFDQCSEKKDGWENNKDAKDALIFTSRLLSLFLLEYRNKSALIEEQKKMHDALEYAQNANRAKTDFFSRMSHDIRTPMNAILGLTVLSLDYENIPNELRKNLTNIHSSCEFLLGLVNDILDMAKIEAGSIELNYKPYLYKDFLAKLKAMFEPLCIKKNITLEFEEIKVSTAVMTDILRLDQIFFNILSNAIKYTPEGGKVSYSTDNVIFTEDTISADCIIQDTGIGMSQEFLEHIFDPFEQENSAYASDIQGSGLGMSITKSLIELMNGSIKLESKKHEGTKVTVHLEFDICKNANINKLSAADSPNISILNGKRILLVEDNTLNSEIAKALLEKKAMTVVHASNGKIAVDKFVNSNPFYFDAILMDIRMPVMDGLDATKAIRNSNHPNAQLIPIIAMSANAYEDDIQESIEAGMNDHTSKPVNPDKLYNILALHLNKSGM